MTSIVEWLYYILGILLIISTLLCIGVELHFSIRRQKKNITECRSELAAQGSKCYGKHYLYNFLVEHGYTVPMEKEMRYRECCGTEYLSGKIIEVDEVLETEKIIHIECYHAAEIIYITISVTEVAEVTEEETEVEFSKYVNGELREQRINGRPTIDKIFEI